MELKHGTVRLNDAAEWLSKTTGRTFTAADLIDAHDKLPICALIPRSKANPKYSGPVRRAMLAKAVEVEIDAEAARKGPLTQREIVEAAKRRLSKGIATRLEIEKTIHEEGIYLLSRRDLHLLARHGVQRLNRGTPFLSLVASRGFQPGLAEAIEFGTPVDVTADMLCVLKGYLVKFAEQVAAQQVEAPAQMPDPARGQEAEPKAGDVQTHQEQAAPAKPKRLTQADRIEGWVIECERRAEALGEPFDRQRMPGKMQDFLDLLHALDVELRSIAKVSTLRDNYTKKRKICKWGDDAGAQPSALPLYARLFPEAKNIAPGVTSAQRRKT